MAAPIALFVFNRPIHTRKTIDALLNNNLARESDLIVFSDGPKKETDKIKIGEIRDYIRTITGFKTVKLVESLANNGLANSIISGVTKVINEYGEIIVMEDDLVCSPFFLDYMNTALKRFQNEEQVISVHGYVYPVKEKLPELFFLKGADCWGWGTWQRGWKLFQYDSIKLLQQLKARNLIRTFDFNGTYPYSDMLKEQVEGKNDSWAVRWHASAFLNNKLTLYPGNSLIQNIGLDETGTHSGKSTLFETKITNWQPDFSYIKIEENRIAHRAFEKYFKSIKRKRWQILISKLKQRLTNAKKAD
jgi:hypothetical protein